MHTDANGGQMDAGEQQAGMDEDEEHERRHGAEDVDEGGDREPDGTRARAARERHQEPAGEGRAERPRTQTRSVVMRPRRRIKGAAWRMMSRLKNWLRIASIRPVSRRKAVSIQRPTITTGTEQHQVGDGPHHQRRGVAGEALRGG